MTFAEAAAAAAEIGNKVESVKQEIEESAPPIPAVEELVPKPEISDNMKTRLRKELESQGANPNKSAGNPILVVAAIVGILVIVGGQGKILARLGMCSFLEQSCRSTECPELIPTTGTRW